MIIALVVAGSVAAMLAYTSNINHQTKRHIASSSAFHAAEAGIDKVHFELAVTKKWETITPTTQENWVQLSNGDSYAVLYSEISESAVTVSVIGRSGTNKGYVYRRLRARFGQGLPEALSYAVFGEKVGFHNHMGKQSAFTITSDVHSNGELLFWDGLAMDGNLTAVGDIKLENKGKFGFIYDEKKLTDGTPGAFYGPLKNPPEPVPEEIPFPKYNYSAAKEIAVANGTYFSSASQFLSYIEARTTKYAVPQSFAFPAPIPSQIDRTMQLTNRDGSIAGIVSKAVISDSIFYVGGDVTLQDECNTVLILTNGALVVEGKLKIQRPMQVYAAYNTPALVATKKVDITDKDHTDGNGGPVTIEGLVYCNEDGEIHIHQTDPYNAVALEGIEVGGYVHNCEWFWFNYKLCAGLGSSFSGGGEVEMLSWHEVPYSK